MQFRVQDDAELPDLPFRIFAGMRVSGDVSSKLRKDEKISFQALFSGVQYVSCLSIKTQRIWHLDELVAKKKKRLVLFITPNHTTDCSTKYGSACPLMYKYSTLAEVSNRDTEILIRIRI